MRACGERNPNAMRVMSRILVFTDSMRPVGEVLLDGGEDGGAVFHDRALQADESGDAAAAGPADPVFERAGGERSRSALHGCSAYLLAGVDDPTHEITMPHSSLLLSGHRHRIRSAT